MIHNNKLSYIENLVEQVKFLAQDVIDRAEDLVGKGDLISEFSIELLFPQGWGVPSINVHKTYLSTHLDTTIHPLSSDKPVMRDAPEPIGGQTLDAYIKSELAGRTLEQRNLDCLDQMGCKYVRDTYSGMENVKDKPTWLQGLPPNFYRMMINSVYGMPHMAKEEGEQHEEC